MIITVSRDVWTDVETAGWIVAGSRKWASIEKPWVPSPLTPGGAKGGSCVPLGEYRLEPHNSEAWPHVWALVNHALDVYHWPWEVPQAKRVFARTVCLIHPANWAHELRGCIGPGKKRGVENGRWRTYDSRSALNEIRSILGSSLDSRVHVVDGRQNGRRE